jgi:CRISPR system Cascade subunit CasB
MKDMVTDSPPAGRDSRFVNEAISRCLTDKGLAARLRRATNPATEYQCWDFLGMFGVDLERDYQRLPFATVSAAIASAQPKTNGAIPLGQGLVLCYDDRQESSQAKARLRRLLACTETVEACRILRPILTLIQSRGAASLNYVRLLGQLRRFHFSPDQVKAQWAQEFYSHRQNTKKGDAA